MKEHLNDLKEIRNLMEKSSKFLSLSGLSGISAGVLALLASIIFYGRNSDSGDLQFLFLLAVGTLLLAILGGIFFTWRKTRKENVTFWNALSKKLVISMSIPLISGGLFSIALILNGVFWPVPAVTLVFYGLALISASQYTYRDVYSLGLLEVLLGIVGLFVVGYSLIFWAVGFGVLHIGYGAIMYYKYDRN